MGKLPYSVINKVLQASALAGRFQLDECGLPVYNDGIQVCTRDTPEPDNGKPLPSWRMPCLECHKGQRAPGKSFCCAACANKFNERKRAVNKAK